MIDIILLALIAGVLIVRFVMVLGERRDDDPTPPVSMLDVIKKQQKEAPALGAGRGQVDVAPVSEEPMPLGFRLKNKNKKSIDEHKGDQEDKRALVALATPGAEAAVAAIKAVDDNFSAKEFVLGAERAFEIILQAFVAGAGEVALEEFSAPQVAETGDGKKNNPTMMASGIEEQAKAEDGKKKRSTVVAKAARSSDKLVSDEGEGKAESKAESKGRAVGKLLGRKESVPKNGLAVLGEYIAPELLSHFEAAIKQRSEQQYHQEPKCLIGIKRVEIMEATARDGGDQGKDSSKILSITLLFESDQIYALYDNTGKLVEGDPHTILPKKDCWTFERQWAGTQRGQEDDRWLLTAVQEG